MSFEDQHPLTIHTVADEFETQRNGFKKGKRSRSLRAHPGGRCVAWVVTSKMAPLRISLLVCHAGDRKSKKAGEFARGQPVPELNGGRELEHTFCAPGEQLEVDLELLATKSAPLLKNYTNPGGLTLSLAVRYQQIGADKELFGADVKLIGSTKRKRVQKQLSQLDPGTPSSAKKLHTGFSVMVDSPLTLSQLTPEPQTPSERAGLRTPLAGLPPNTLEDLKSLPFFAIKGSPQVNLTPEPMDPELAYLCGLFSSRESSTLEEQESMEPEEPMETEEGPGEAEDPIARAMGLQAFDEGSYLARMLGS